MAAEVRAVAGPRILGRLTPDLMLRSPQYMNCVGQYEIDMRGNRITMIENLGATENQFDSMDLSDNAIVRLEGFPKLQRLRALHLNNNRINRIGHGLEDTIPRLEWLLLTGNKLSALADLDALASLPRLRYLSLLDNPVAKQPGYRLYVISRFKQLKVLDFRKVKQKEREEAARIHGEAPVLQAANTFEPDEDTAAKTASRPAQKAVDINAIKSAIAAAQTLEEVRQLEQALKATST